MTSNSFGGDLMSSYINGACMCMLICFSRIQLCVTLWAVAHQAPPSLGFSRQEHWSGLPFPSPRHKSEKWKWSRSVVSNSQRPHGLQPTRLLHPWELPGKSTGVGHHGLCPKTALSGSSLSLSLSHTHTHTKNPCFLPLLSPKKKHNLFPSFKTVSHSNNFFLYGNSPDILETKN